MGEQITIFGMDGLEKTKNSFIEEASMNKSRVGERESRLTHITGASMNKSSVGE